MRLSRERLRRRLRRAGDWVWPREARAFVRQSGWTAGSVLAGMLFYANSAQACLTMPPGSVAMGASLHLEETVALDRSTSVVHASLRSTPRLSPSMRREEPAGSLPAEPTDSVNVAATWSATAPAAATAQAPSTGLATVSVPTGTPPAADRAILQGEFAVLLVQTLQLRAPSGGWAPGSASTVLASVRLRPGEAIGVTPAGGWNLDKPLREGVLASLLRDLGLQVYSQSPDRLITVQEAEVILSKISALFRPLAPAAFMAGPGAGQSLSLGNPTAPLSPFTP